MKIQVKTMKDISKTFEKMAHSMGGSNYIVELEARTFQYDQFSDFTIDTLKELYQEKLTFDVRRNSTFIDNMEFPIIGSVNKINFSLAKENVEESLRSTCDDYPGAYRDMLGTFTGWSVSPEIAKQRLGIFWDIINAHFTMPPTHCFEHKPEHDSFFGGGVMWEFCYILLNDNTKEGIVIAGQAYD